MSMLRPVARTGPMLVLAALGVAVLPACVQVRDSDVVSLDGASVQQTVVRNDRGDVRVFGNGASSQIVVEGVAWGSGSRRGAAENRQDTVRWEAAVQGATLRVDGIAPGGRRGVDLTITGPELVDLDINTDNGTVEIGNIEGFHTITAHRVIGRAVGDLDLITSGSVDLDFIPYVETDAIIEANGGVTLAIPFGLDYDLTVRGDPADSIVVDELGWDELVLGEGFINGYRGRGDVEIDIRSDGPVRIVELR